MIEDLLYNLIPYDVDGHSKVRHGVNYDGGYVVIDGLVYDALYGYGVENDVEFELAFLDHHPVTCHLYDHTIDSLPLAHPLLHWKKIGVGPIKTRELDTLENHIIENGHEDSCNLFLSMDIEGAEWATILGSKEHTLTHFQQIVMEIHGLSDDSRGGTLREKVAALTKLNHFFKIVHVHHNNFSKIVEVNGFRVPETLEVTFLRKDSFNFLPSNTNYPIANLDYPNCWKTRHECYSRQGDAPLNFWPFAPSS